MECTYLGLQRPITQNWYDRLNVAAAGAIPQTIKFFDVARAGTTNISLTNNPGNPLPQGHEMKVLGMSFAFIGTHRLDVDIMALNFAAIFTLNGKEVFAERIFNWPQCGGSNGDTAITNGVTGSNSVSNFLVRANIPPFTIPQQTQFSAVLYSETSGLTATAAGSGGTGIKLFWNFLVDWTQP